MVWDVTILDLLMDRLPREWVLFFLMPEPIESVACLYMFVCVMHEVGMCVCVCVCVQCPVHIYWLCSVLCGPSRLLNYDLTYAVPQ